MSDTCPDLAFMTERRVRSNSWTASLFPTSFPSGYPSFRHHAGPAAVCITRMLHRPQRCRPTGATVGEQQSAADSLNPQNVASSVSGTRDSDYKWREPRSTVVLSCSGTKHANDLVFQAE